MPAPEESQWIGSSTSTPTSRSRRTSSPTGSRARYRDQGPRLVRDERSGYDVWKVGGATIASVGHTATAGWPDRFPSSPKTMDDVPRAAWNAEARLEYLDEIGVWAQVMYPNVGGFGNQAFLKLKDAELQLACVRAYNDWMTDWCSVDPRRMLAVTATPFWDVDASVAEIERCAEAGHRGVLFTGEPQRYDLPFLGDPHWDPLWAAAQDAGLPVSFHIGSGDIASGFSPGRIKAHGPGGAYVSTSVSLFLTNGAQIVGSAHLGCAATLPRPQVRVGRERDRVPAVRARGGRLRVRRVVDGDRPAR